MKTDCSEELVTAGEPEIQNMGASGMWKFSEKGKDKKAVLTASRNLLTP